MKRLFTLALVMAMAVTGFAQVKGVSKNMKMNPAQQQVFRGEEAVMANFPSATRSIMVTPEVTELAYSTYDWQTNAGARNYTAVWPDGFAVMCYTLATTTDYSDRGTGLAWFDPAVGEWEFNELRAEGVKTGFGCVARYKENGLVIAAHTANDCRIFINEDFRNDPTASFGEGIVMPAPEGCDPCWPVVQCSGAGLDIIHVLCTNNGVTDPYKDPIIYYQYANGAWTREAEILPGMTANELSDAGSNVTYFMQYDPAKPNRVSFILNNAWSDCKLVISEDNGATWTDKVFWQHPGINTTFESIVYYPRWVDASFDSEDNLNIVYEINGTTGEPASGSYYPGIGAVSFWSETLPKHDSCLGGIGNFGEPFIMDTTYLSQDIRGSEPYWSDQIHMTLPEHFGMVVALDMDYQALQWDDQENWPAEYYWPSGDDAASWADHGKYNNGPITMPSMHIDGNRVYAFWSMICGDGHSVFFNSTANQYYLRLFCSMSTDGGRTWLGTKQVHAENAVTAYDEMVYGQLIPYVYTDTEGAYVWYCYQKDGTPGTFVQYPGEDQYDDQPADNYYFAVKVYLDYIGDDVEENTMVAAQTINVYPNPAQGAFNVVLTQESDVNIYNAVGQLVKTYNNVKEVNVNLESGVYFVNAGTQTTKVIVK